MNDSELDNLCRRKNDCVDLAKQFEHDGNLHNARKYFADAATLDAQIGDAFAAKNDFFEAVVNWVSAGYYYDAAQDFVRANDVYKKAVSVASTHPGATSRGLLIELRKHL